MIDLQTPSSPCERDLPRLPRGLTLPQYLSMLRRPIFHEMKRQNLNGSGAVNLIPLNLCLNNLGWNSRIVGIFYTHEKASSQFGAIFALKLEGVLVASIKGTIGWEKIGADQLKAWRRSGALKRVDNLCLVPRHMTEDEVDLRASRYIKMFPALTKIHLHENVLPKVEQSILQCTTGVHQSGDTVRRI